MSDVSRYLFLILLLQLHGADGTNSSFALIPPPAPDNSLDQEVVPIALRYRQQVLAQIKASQEPGHFLPTTDAPPSKGTCRAEMTNQPALGGTDLLYLLMSLTR